jgi:hypothetical protein
LSARIVRSPYAVTAALGSGALLVVFGIVLAPDEAFRASLAGLQVWWQTVFPGLLPPLIMAELLAGSGLLHGLAALAEPLARLFRLPGAAAWAMAFGWTAGIPAGAKETARLRSRNLIGDRDVGALLLLSHLPNPFLVVIVVGSGFLQSPALGWAIAAGLWLSAAIGGIAWSALAGRGPKRGREAPPAPKPALPAAAWRRALLAVRQARAEDGRPLGKQLADAVQQAVGTLMLIGGLIILSAVCLRLVQLAFPDTDGWLVVPGLIEMHLGAYESGQSALFSAAPARAAALLAAFLAWSGFSGLLQARAAYGTAAPAFPWGAMIGARLLHAALALAVTYPLAQRAMRAEPGSGAFGGLLPVWSGEEPGVALPGGWLLGSATALTFLAFLASLALLALLAAAIRPAPRKRPRK